MVNDLHSFGCGLNKAVFVQALKCISFLGNTFTKDLRVEDKQRFYTWGSQCPLTGFEKKMSQSNAAYFQSLFHIYVFIY